MSLTVAILPARGGSKRIPGKNVRSVCGKPMIAWPVGTALESGLFDLIVVSTDDAEIGRIAIEAGATHAIDRPKNLADDFTPLRPVINDAILQVEGMRGEAVSNVCCLLPTAILMRHGDLLTGYEAIKNRQFQFAFSAASFPSPIQRALRREKNGVAMMYPEHRLTRSQDLEEAFHDAGQFYWGSRDAFLQELPMYSPQSLPIIVPRRFECDIDTAEDLELAESLLSLKIYQDRLPT